MRKKPVPRPPGIVRRGLGWILRLFITPIDSPSSETGARESVSPPERVQAHLFEFPVEHSADRFHRQLDVIGVESYVTGKHVVAAVPYVELRAINDLVGKNGGNRVA